MINHRLIHRGIVVLAMVTAILVGNVCYQLARGQTKTNPQHGNLEVLGYFLRQHAREVFHTDDPPWRTAHKAGRSG